MTNFHPAPVDAVHAGIGFQRLDTMKRAYAHAIGKGLPVLFLRRRLPAVS